MGESATGQSGSTPRRGRPSTPGSSVLTPPTGLPSLGAMVPAQRAADDYPPPVRDDRPPVAPTPVRPVVAAPCACGHAKDAHDHYRPGSDCGACGAAACAEFRPEGGPVRRALRRWGLTD